jgi:hypothetical protein
MAVILNPRTCLALLGPFLALTGCTARKVDYPLEPAEDRLYKLGKAYLQAGYRLGRPPQGAEDLKPNLEGDTPEGVLRSPRDGEPFIVLWGIDYNALAPQPRDPFTVAAYEKTGVDGKRYVLRFPLAVALLSDEDLRKAVFPPGHGPPPP